MSGHPVNSHKQTIVLDLSVIFILSVAVYLVAGRYDFMEALMEYSRKHEDWELDEILFTFIFLVFALAVFSVRRWIELRKALLEIKQLRGIIPICSSCKKIRDDVGYWQQFEIYIREHSEIEFSHGICPDCKAALRSEYINAGQE